MMSEAVGAQPCRALKRALLREEDEVPFSPVVSFQAVVPFLRALIPCEGGPSWGPSSLGLSLRHT